MARIGVSITKSCTFRGAPQEFSNVYYYDGLPSQPSENEATQIINTVANRERAWHALAVTFVRGRLWSQGGSPGSNEMISQVNLSGTGARTTDASIDRERAFLFRLRAGSDSRGRPVYLRKWFHACGQFVSGQSINSNVAANISGWTQAERDAQVAAMNNIGQIADPPGVGTLTSKNGRTTSAGNPWQAHQYLEHHQLGDQWRAQ